MSSDPSLRVPLGDQVDRTSEPLRERVVQAAALDPISPIEPPQGTPCVRAVDVVESTAFRKHVHLVDTRGSSMAWVAAHLAKTRRVVCVVPDTDDARQFANNVRFFGAHDDASVLVLPSAEHSPYADVSPDRRLSMARLAVLHTLRHDLPWRMLVVPAPALIRKVVPPILFDALRTRIESETALDRDEMIGRWVSMGYLRVPLVEDPGSFAVRGALLDVWPVQSPQPVRIELFGEDVLSIRPFDPMDQKTLRDISLRDVWISPAKENIAKSATTLRQQLIDLTETYNMPTLKARALIDDVVMGRAFFGAEGFLPAYFEELSGLTDYVPSDALFVLDDPERIAAAIAQERGAAERDQLTKETAVHYSLADFYESDERVAETLSSKKLVVSHPLVALGDSSAFAELVQPAEPESLFAIDLSDLQRAMKASRSTRERAGTLEPLVNRLHYWQEGGLCPIIVARTVTQADRLGSLLAHQGTPCITETQPRDFTSDRPSSSSPLIIAVGALSAGFIAPLEGLVFITEDEIVGGQAVKRARARRATNDKSRPFVEDLELLKTGELVVHVEHGIGRYQGLIHREMAGTKIDLLVIEYAAGDKLYLPVYRLSQLQKFSGGEGANPKLDRLGGSTFSKTKARIRGEVRKLADELLRLYAEREALPGEALAPPADDYFAFEATFPYDETPDQAKAIDDVNHDLERTRPMDRLICGDVGFGKTEVAMRAAFRMAMGGKQVALLCPTTVLAQQHLRTFEARFSEFPITVRGLSRFQNQGEQRTTLSGLKEGSVDVVIGTHRLLSKDVHFKKLGLLVVDEEQRFGVAHKERMKQLKTHVDVLTLSATPIPRTLQMAVTGLRDLSLITTPPVDRRAVRTIVARDDPGLIREAILRELARGGQVFFVFNRIDGLYERATRLRALVPEARIAIAHGQMGKTRRTGVEGAVVENSFLEDVMLDFLEGRYDVLASTSIIESGLDIARANTIIIDRADMFGLAQLYQLRGRVGRSKERAYCYLLVPPPEQMTDESRLRIEALERHTELGSGFRVASLDLELRGAGDLLGAEQSGNVASVGLELFCSMLEETIHELRGEVVVHDVDPELTFDVSALLPEDYVADVGLRLSFYKRLASAMDEAHVAEIAEELEDRFGTPPQESRALVHLMTLKVELRRLRVLGCEASERTVTLHLQNDTPLDAAKLAELVRKPKSPYKLTPDGRLSRRFDSGDGISNTETMLEELSRLTHP